LAQNLPESAGESFTSRFWQILSRSKDYRQINFDFWAKTVVFDLGIFHFPWLYCWQICQHSSPAGGNADLTDRFLVLIYDSRPPISFDSSETTKLHS
jgi:hypothetical protein